VHCSVQRAEEMRKANTEVSRTVAFFCGKYAMELGISLSDRSPEVKAFLLELMKELEAGKVKMDDAAAKALVEDFAMQVFQRADDVDRAGNADKSTAQSFYAAATFMEILKQFSATKELDEDIKATQLYAKWKATDIVRAIKEGRKPTPGGPEDHLAVAAADAHEDDYASEAPAAMPPPVNFPPLPPAAPPSPAVPTVPTHRPAPASAALPAAAARPSSAPLKALSKAQREDVLEYIKFAKVAVEKDTVDVAIAKLEGALRLLHENA